MGFWDKYGEAIEQETAFTGGARVVGRVKIELGYKLYISGAEPSWFPVSDSNDKDQRKAQLAAANKVRAEMGFKGNSRRPQYGIQITRYTKDTAQLNDDDPNDVKWDQIDWTPEFLTENVDARLATRGAKSVRLYNWETQESITVPASEIPKRAFDLLVESLDEFGIDPAGWEGYITLWFHDDPDQVYFGESAMGYDEYRKENRYPQFVTVSGAWATEKEAHAAVMKLRGTETSTSSSSNSDESWDDETWDALIPEIRDEIIGGKSKVAVARDYGIPLAEMVKRLKTAENDIPY